MGNGCGAGGRLWDWVRDEVGELGQTQVLRGKAVEVTRRSLWRSDQKQGKARHGPGQRWG